MVVVSVDDNLTYGRSDAEHVINLDAVLKSSLNQSLSLRSRNIGLCSRVLSI